MTAEGDRDMTAEKVLKELEAIGYMLSVTERGTIRAILPGSLTPPEQAERLLDALRANKAAALSALRDREAGFVEEAPTAGALHSISMDMKDEESLKRWAIAIQAGIVAREGLVQVHPRSGVVKIAYRCTLPDEWLEEAIAMAAKRQYNAVLERIQEGEAWLLASADDPTYSERHERYLALFEMLRLSYLTVGEPLDDPLKGYMEAIP